MILLTAILFRIHMQHYGKNIVDGFNLVEDCTDAEQYKTVLEMIFDKLKQGQHFKMMTAKNIN